MFCMRLCLSGLIFTSAILLKRLLPLHDPRLFDLFHFPLLLDLPPQKPPPHPHPSRSPFPRYFIFAQTVSESPSSQFNYWMNFTIFELNQWTFLFSFMLLIHSLELFLLQLLLCYLFHITWFSSFNWIIQKNANL